MREQYIEREANEDGHGAVENRSQMIPCLLMIYDMEYAHGRNSISRGEAPM